jgi:hypothetical protein
VGKSEREDLVRLIRQRENSEFLTDSLPLRCFAVDPFVDLEAPPTEPRPIHATRLPLK